MQADAGGYLPQEPLERWEREAAAAGDMLQVHPLVLSHMMCLLINFRKSTPPPKSSLFVDYYCDKYIMSDKVAAKILARSSNIWLLRPGTCSRYILISQKVFVK